ncbi:GGDEF domain-containing protein [Candidatus Peregrinibacteria bacterium]|nr:MAG: GGDEF domain-containing protein [Candidatus Peregrinibacteria bacterium]
MDEEKKWFHRPSEAELRALKDGKSAEEQELIDTRAALLRTALDKDGVERDLEVARREATTDALTGLPNRRTFERAYEIEYRNAMRARRFISIVAFDMDHFKKVNDTLGHAAGDEVLKILADIIRNVIKRKTDHIAHTRRNLNKTPITDNPQSLYEITSDLSAGFGTVDLFEQNLQEPQGEMGRIGGEEFLVVLPDTSSVGAQIVAEMLREKVESELKNKLKEKKAALGIDDEQIDQIAGTISLGIATSAPTKLTDDDEIKKAMKTLVDRADKGLYVAKNSGRNTIGYVKDDGTIGLTNKEQYQRELEKEIGQAKEELELLEKRANIIKNLKAEKEGQSDVIDALDEALKSIIRQQFELAERLEKLIKIKEELST